MATIPEGPHYEIAASELAAWIEQQGADMWWIVDGDEVLLRRGIRSPGPADKLAAALRKMDCFLLVQAREDDVAARGQPILAAKLDEIAAPLFPYDARTGVLREEPQDRCLYLCWKGSPDEWLLSEDREIGEAMRGNEVETAS